MFVPSSEVITPISILSPCPPCSQTANESSGLCLCCPAQTRLLAFTVNLHTSLCVRVIVYELVFNSPDWISLFGKVSQPGLRRSGSLSFSHYHPISYSSSLKNVSFLTSIRLQKQTLETTVMFTAAANKQSFCWSRYFLHPAWSVTDFFQCRLFLLSTFRLIRPLETIYGNGLVSVQLLHSRLVCTCIIWPLVYKE